MSVSSLLSGSDTDVGYSGHSLWLTPPLADRQLARQFQSAGPPITNAPNSLPFQQELNFQSANNNTFFDLPDAPRSDLALSRNGICKWSGDVA